MKKTLFILFCLNFLIPQEVSGYDIIKQMNEKDFSSNIKATLSMKTVNQKGIVKELTFISWVKNNKDTQNQMIWFLYPASFKGISFLKKSENSYMTMWYPKYKKERKISKKNQGNSFMSSELAYEDLYKRNINNFKYAIIDQKVINNIDCYLVESIPNNSLESSYSKHHTWISKKLLIPIEEVSFNLDEEYYKKKIYYYNDRNKLDSIKVKNLKKDTYTVLYFKNVDTESEIDDKDFNERKLRSLRGLKND